MSAKPSRHRWRQPVILVIASLVATALDLALGSVVPLRFFLGVAVVALGSARFSRIPLLVIGALGGRVVMEDSIDLQSLGILAELLGVVLGVRLYQRLPRSGKPFGRPIDLVHYIFCLGVIGSLGACVTLFATNWLGGFAGEAVVSFPREWLSRIHTVVIFGALAQSGAISGRVRLEAPLFFGLIATLIYASGSLSRLIASHPSSAIHTVDLLIMAVVFFCAVRLGPRGAGVASLLVSTSHLFLSDGSDDLAASVFPALELQAVVLSTSSALVASVFRRRSKIERCLSESEERWRSIWKHSPDNIAEIDLDGRLLLSNRSERGAGEEFESRISDGADERLSKALDAMQFDASLRSWEWFDGRRWWARRLVAVRRSFRVSSALLIETDITERRRSEQILKSSEEKFRVLFEELPIGFVLCDVNGRIFQSNKELVGILSKDGPRATSYEELLDPREGEHAKHDLEELSESGRFGPVERRLRRPQGDSIAVLVNGVVVAEQDGRRRAWISIEDISELKEVERSLRSAKVVAEAADKAKSEFLATMSHEIRTPMNGVIGMTELLQRSALTPEQSEFVETIRKCGDTLVTLVSDILDYSKIEAGKLELERVDFGLPPELEELLELLVEAAHKKRLEIMCRIAPDVPRRACGDPARLRQVLINLLSNAVKFTDKGEVRLEVYSVKDSTGNPRVRFEVSDTGIGIKPEALERLFRPFSQADSSTTRKFGGTGLGLVICDRLIDIMGGKIEVSSQEGKGTTFGFDIPLPEAKDGEALEDPPKLADRTALIVAPNQNFSGILAESLGRWGAKAHSVRSLRDAEARLDQGPWHMVFLDSAALAEASRDDAAEFCKRATERQSQVVALSTIPTRGLVARLRRHGVTTELSKPIRQSRLESVVRSLLGETSMSVKKPAKAAGEVDRTDLLPKDLRILVAEDNPVNKKLVLKMLERYGLRPEFVESGDLALEAVKLRSFDVVLMDCQMPGLDGFEATKAIREFEKENRDGERVPIVALTANAMPGDRERCLAAGMDDYLTKPIRMQLLARMIEKWASA
ncbi:MAG: ATP-binding protein [Planctomycetota bacterium]